MEKFYFVFFYFFFFHCGSFKIKISFLADDDELHDMHTTMSQRVQDIKVDS